MKQNMLNEYTEIQINISKKFPFYNNSIIFGSKIVPTQFVRATRISSLFFLNSNFNEPLNHGSISYFELIIIYKFIFICIIAFATKNKIDFIVKVLRKNEKDSIFCK